MATIQRPTKEGSVRTYQEKIGLGYVDILASEMDADLDTIYAAWNGGVDSVTLKDNAVTTAKIGDGQVTYAKLAPDAKLWEDTGATLRPGPSFAARPLAIASTNYQLTLGSATIKGVVDVATNGGLSILTNHPWAPNDLAIGSWLLAMDPASNIIIYRRAAGAAAGTVTGPLILDANGELTVTRAFRVGSAVYWSRGTDAYMATNDPGFSGFNAGLPSWGLIMQHSGGDAFQLTHKTAGAAGYNQNAMIVDGAQNLAIGGSVATKASGTTWANPSDERMKRNVTDYGTGLDAIIHLRPVRFEYNGAYGTVDDGRTCYGFIAQEVEPVMPECVGEHDWTPSPLAEGEETPAPVTVKTLDQSNMILALVNAVKELATRVAALESPA
jgi:hypothetical protein